MDDVCLVKLIAILFGIQGSFGKSVSNSCGRLWYDEPAVVSRNVTLYFQPSGYNTQLEVAVQWFFIIDGGWTRVNDPRHHISGLNMTITTTIKDKGRMFLAFHGMCYSPTLNLVLKDFAFFDVYDLNCEGVFFVASYRVGCSGSSRYKPCLWINTYADIDETSCGGWFRRSADDVRLGETLELSYFPTINIVTSALAVYVQWITVTNSTCPAPRGCDVTNVTGVYEIRHIPRNHEYVLSIVMRQDYNVTGRYRLQCTDRSSNVKYTDYINVTVPEHDPPVWRETQTLSGCDNCLVGILGTYMTVRCRASIKAQQLQVRLYTANENLTATLEPSSGLYRARFIMTEQLNMTDVNCSESNIALDTPLVATATLFVAVRPNPPMWQDTQTLLDCDSCLVGTLNQSMTVLCNASGGTEPLNVWIQLGSEILLGSIKATDLYQVNFTVTEQMHMAELRCSVSNIVLVTPVVAVATLYVAVTPPHLKFLAPDAKQGEPSTFPSCTSSGARPPANVTLHVLHVESGDVEVDRVTNAIEEGRFNTTTMALSLKSVWNGKSMNCCVHHITLNDAECKTTMLVYKFPPASVRIAMAVNHTDNRPSEGYAVQCVISRSFPACSATWELPDNMTRLSEISERVIDVPGYTTTSYMSLYASPSDNGKLITCTANCTDFDNGTLTRHKIQMEEAKSQVGDVLPLPMIMVSAGIALVIVVVCVAITVVVVRRKSRKREVKEVVDGAHTPLPQRTGNEVTDAAHTQMPQRTGNEVLYEEVEDDANRGNVQGSFVYDYATAQSHPESRVSHENRPAQSTSTRGDTGGNTDRKSPTKGEAGYVDTAKNTPGNTGLAKTANMHEAGADKAVYESLIEKPENEACYTALKDDNDLPEGVDKRGTDGDKTTYESLTKTPENEACYTALQDSDGVTEGVNVCGASGDTFAYEALNKRPITETRYETLKDDDHYEMTM